MPTPKYANSPPGGFFRPDAFVPGSPDGYPVVTATPGRYPGPIKQREWKQARIIYDAYVEIFDTGVEDHLARYKMLVDLWANGNAHFVRRTQEWDPNTGSWKIYCEWLVPYRQMPDR
jgi:hypothetical protein